MNNNKKIALILSLIVFSFLSILYVFVFKISTFTIKSDIDDFTIILTDVKNQNHIYTLKPNTSNRIQKSIYKLHIQSDKYSDQVQEVDLNHNTELELKPDFSNKYSQQIFKDDIKQISELLIKKYNFIHLKPIKIFFKNRGDFLIATISEETKSVRVNDLVDVFKVIFRKNQSSWEQLTEPQLIFNEKDFSNIPKPILDSTNSILQDF